jgi:hypothetical protein
VRLVFVAALVAAAACGEREQSGSVDAARADSSAAGYAVGRRTDSARDDSARRDGTRADSATKLTSTAPVVPGDAARAAAAGRSPATSADTSPAGRAANGGHVAAVTTAKAPKGDTARADSSRPKLPNVAAGARSDSAGHATVPAGPVRVNEFLTYDARSRTVSLQLIAGYNGLNGSLNYNGAINGSHGLIVPTGWRIHVAVTNRDSDLQHSAIVIAKVLPPPIEPADPAFDGAALPRLDEGLQEDETGTMDFIAARPGHFMIACGVPGHAQAGEWLELLVTNSALPPAYR